jgi:hypothetical protein
MTARIDAISAAWLNHIAQLEPSDMGVFDRLEGTNLHDVNLHP